MIAWASAKFIDPLFLLVWAFCGTKALVAPLPAVPTGRMFESDSFDPTIGVPHDSRVNTRFPIKLFLF